WLVAPLYRSQGTWVWALAAVSMTALLSTVALRCGRTLAGCLTVGSLDVALCVLAASAAMVAAVIAGAWAWLMWAGATQAITALWLVMVKRTITGLQNLLPRVLFLTTGGVAVLLTGAAWLGPAGAVALATLVCLASLIGESGSSSLVTI